MFSLGIPFFHMGQEIAASKEGQHNSYNLGDRYNMLRYAATSRYQTMIKAFQSLTSLRKKLPLLKQPFEAKHIEFIHHHRHLVEMKLHQENPVSIFFNTSQEALPLPKLFGTLLFDGKTSVHTPFDHFHIEAFTCLVVAQS
jgi:pullulanase/glycogen debranching enzyme